VGGVALTLIGGVAQDLHERVVVRQGSVRRPMCLTSMTRS
jgi:hypothetical protein